MQSKPPLVLVLHGLYPDDQTRRKDRSRIPFERFTVADLRACIRFLKAAGYRFVGPEAYPHPPDRSILLTFDDGYANNRLALPVLEAEQVPMVLFVASSFSEKPRKYWWDVAYAETLAATGSHRQALQAVEAFKDQPLETKEDTLRQRFGEQAFRPADEQDRPMTADELRIYAQSPWVHLAPHTHTHPILSTLHPEQLQAELQTNRNWLRGVSDRMLPWLAYPNGNPAPEHNTALQAMGIEMGFGMGRLGDFTRRTAAWQPYDIPRFAPVAGWGLRASLVWLVQPTRLHYLHWYLRRRTELQLTGR